MANIRAFRGWRYNDTLSAQGASTFAPMAEVIGPQQLQKLYETPHQALHVSLPQSLPQAAQKLSEWKSERVVVQDEAPLLYAYSQQFTLFGQAKPFIRRGFLCLIQLDDEKIILHEGVLPKAVEARADLLENLHMQTAPTHGLYDDPNFEIEPILDAYLAKPEITFLDVQGVINKFSPITDPEHQQYIEKVMEPRRVYLADGHHRIAGSYAYQSKAGKTNPLADYHLMYISNLAGDDLRILPTHRMWRPRVKPDVPALRDALSEWFDLEDVSRSKKPLFALLKDRKNAFGLASLGRRWIMQLREGLSPESLIALDLPDAVKQLDYTLLHYLVFDKVMGIPYDEQRSSQELVYEKDYSTAMASVNRGQAALTFIAREVQVQSFLDVCRSGAIMPPKSTYFYPKVACGLVYAEM